MARLTTAVEQALKFLVTNPAMTDLAAASLLNFGLASTSTKKLCASISQLASELHHPLLSGKNSISACYPVSFVCF